MNDIMVRPEFDTYRPEVLAHNGEALAVRFDVGGLLEAKLGPDWQQETCRVIAAGTPINRSGEHYTVREPDSNFVLDMTAGEELVRQFPGIWELYQGAFKQMMQAALPAGAEQLKLRQDPNDAIEAFSQRPTDPFTTEKRRMEAHVDQCYTCVLALDAPADGEQQGGRLVIAHNPAANSIEEINADATFITHRPGTLLCFSKGRTYPHYTEEVNDPAARRIMVGLNYPVESETPEEARALTWHAYNRSE